MRRSAPGPKMVRQEHSVRVVGRPLAGHLDEIRKRPHWNAARVPPLPDGTAYVGLGYPYASQVVVHLFVRLLRVDRGRDNVDGGVPLRCIRSRRSAEITLDRSDASALS